MGCAGSKAKEVEAVATPVATESKPADVSDVTLKDKAAGLYPSSDVAVGEGVPLPQESAIAAPYTEPTKEDIADLFRRLGISAQDLTCSEKLLLNSTGLPSYSIDAMAAQLTSLGAPMLRVLCLAGIRGLNDETSPRLAAALASAAPGLEELDLQGPPVARGEIGDAGGAALALALPKLRKLSTLRLGRNQVGDAGAQALVEAAPQAPALLVLELERNVFGLESARSLVGAFGHAFGAALVEADPWLLPVERLALRSAELSDADVELAAATLKSARPSDHPPLISLDLSSNQLTRCPGLFTLLGSGAAPDLAILDLAHNALEGAPLAADLAGALGALPKLMRLGLEGSRLGNEGAAALAEALSTAGLKALGELGLARTGIGDSGVGALSEAGLGALPALSKLQLQHNTIEDDGLASLARAFDSGHAPSLITLSLWGNPFRASVKTSMLGSATPPGLKALKVACKQRQRFQLELKAA